MKIKHKIYADALKAMRIPILLHTASTSAEGILTVFTAAILGQFADSVFRLDFSLGTQSAVRLSFTLLAMIVFLPALSLVADMFMLKYALVHDRMVLGRFLDKTYDSILRYELGDIQNRLDWDPCNLRCYLVDYFDKGLMVPVTFAFLLFHALRLSPAYTLIVFALSLLKLAVPLAPHYRVPDFPEIFHAGNYDGSRQRLTGCERLCWKPISGKQVTVKPKSDL